MNVALKLLVAIACLCVITVSSHYGYARYREYIADQQRAESERNEALSAVQRAKERLQQLAAEEKEQQDAARVRRREENAERRRKFLERVKARQEKREP
jgi:biopolymer transport protein ExbB/TolQ